MIGEVSALRQKQAAVEAELAEKEAELEAATAALEKEQRTPRRSPRPAAAARSAVLRERLVAIYEAGSPDVVNAILESEDWSQMAAQTEYLNRIQSYDDSVVGRVKTLRDEVTGAVAQAGRQPRPRSKTRATRSPRSSAKSPPPRAEAEARFAELKSAQAERREAMEALESPAKKRSATTSPRSPTRSPPKAAPTGVPTGEVPAPLNPGESARCISESEASAPAAAPQAVKDAIAAANSIAITPYIWGGGHGSFESSGYDCSGAVSFALHGGGFLESPLDSTGLETWGEAGPGQVDHRLRQRRTRLDGDRRHRLRHRRRPRPALARPLGRLARRLHRPPPRAATEPRTRLVPGRLAFRRPMGDLERASWRRCWRSRTSSRRRSSASGRSGATRRSTRRPPPTRRPGGRRRRRSCSTGTTSRARASTTPTRPSTSGSRTGA